MATILKRPADAASSMRLPVRGHDARSALRTPEPVARPEPVVDAEAAKAEMGLLRQQAVQEGLAQGRAQAEREVREALEAELSRWRSGFEAMESEVSKKLQSIETLAISIGFEAFANVLGDAYLQRDALLQSVRRLIDAAGASPTLVVHVAPVQLERVRAALAEQLASQRSRLQFEGDPSLSDTDCRVVSAQGQWETGLALQLQTIQDVCLAAIERSDLQP